MAVLRYLPKLKRSLGLAFDAHFLHDFSTQKIPYLKLYLWTKFECQIIFPSQDIKQNMLSVSLLGN